MNPEFNERQNSAAMAPLANSERRASGNLRRPLLHRTSQVPIAVSHDQIGERTLPTASYGPECPVRAGFEWVADSKLEMAPMAPWLAILGQTYEDLT